MFDNLSTTSSFSFSCTTGGVRKLGIRPKSCLLSSTGGYTSYNHILILQTSFEMNTAQGGHLCIRRHLLLENGGRHGIISSLHSDFLPVFE